MITKRVDVMVHGGDRQLFAGAELRCTVVDIFNRQKRLVDGRRVPSLFTLDLDLAFDGPQVYGLLVEAAGWRPGWHLISHEDFLRPEGDRPIERDQVILRVLLTPTRAEPADLAAAHARLAARGSPFVGPGGLDAAAFAALAPAAAMAFLNIEAKLRATTVDGRPLLSFVAGIERVAVDRVFLLMRSTAKALVDASPQFAGAPGHKPLHLDSWKHRLFEHGNVQLSFTRDIAATAAVAGCHSVDVDIDLEQGVGHAFEWLRNNVFERGHKTDQVSVFALLFDQNILPEYTLAAVAVRAAARRPRALPPAPRAAAKRPAKKRAAKKPVAKKRIATRRPATRRPVKKRAATKRGATTKRVAKKAKKARKRS